MAAAQTLTIVGQIGAWLMMVGVVIKARLRQLFEFLKH